MQHMLGGSGRESRRENCADLEYSSMSTVYTKYSTGISNLGLSRA